MRYAEAGFDLEIDLTRGSIEKVATDPSSSERHLGGQGSAAQLLWERVPPEVDALSGDNLLIFSAGLLAATPVPGANRTSVSAIDPQTNLYVNASLGGFFAPEMKHAGYDKIVIAGKSEDLVYLWIKDDKVDIRDAAHLRGKSALETAALIRQELKDDKLQVAAIGLAGENRVSQASIDHANCSAARGVGVVMGDKGLKAIAVRGTRDIHVAQPEQLFELCKRMHQEIYDNPHCGDILLREDDDSYHVRHPAWSEAPGQVRAFCSKELQEAWEVRVDSEIVSHQWENYSQELEEVRETLVDRSRRLRGTGCHNCLKDCHEVIALPGGRKYFLKDFGKLACALAAHQELEIDYDVLFALQEYGLDEISMAQTVASAVELYEAGALGDEDLPDFPSDGIGRFSYLIERVVQRQGIGDALADAVDGAARREDKIEGSFPQRPIADREERAAFVTGWDAAPERFKQLFLEWEPGQDHSIEAAVDIADWNESMHYIDEALGICPLLSSFRGQYGGRPTYHINNLPQLTALAAGRTGDVAGLWQVAVRNRDLVRAINAGRGMSEAAK